jgi:hypothetical protein
MFESSFLINLFRDRSVARIFYKSSQSYRHANHGNKHLGTEGVCNIQIKHFQAYTWNTLKHLKHIPVTWMCKQHLDLILQHLDKTLAIFVWNRWNIWNIHFKHMCIAITTDATSRSTFVTSIYNKQIYLLLGRTEAHRHRAWRWRGAQSYEVAWRSPVWSSSVA